MRYVYFVQYTADVLGESLYIYLCVRTFYSGGKAVVVHSGPGGVKHVNEGRMKDLSQQTVVCTSVFPGRYILTPLLMNRTERTRTSAC